MIKKSKYANVSENQFLSFLDTNNRIRCIKMFSKSLVTNRAKNQ